MKSELRPYSSTPSETRDGVVSEKKGNRNLKIAGEDTISESIMNSPISSSIVKNEYIFSPAAPRAELGEAEGFGTMCASLKSERIDLLRCNSPGLEEKCTLNHPVIINDNGSNHHTNAQTSIPGNTLRHNMTFGSLNFSTSILTQSMNSSFYQTASSTTARSCINSPYVWNIVKKKESKNSCLDSRKDSRPTQAGPPESVNPILSKLHTQIPRKSKRQMVQNNCTGTDQVDGVKDGGRCLDGSEFFSSKDDSPSRVTSAVTTSSTISENTSLSNLQRAPAIYSGSAVGADEASLVVSSQLRNKGATVSFVDGKIEDAVYSKNIQSQYSPSLRSFVKSDQNHRKPSLRSEVTIKGGYTSYVKGMMSFRSRGSNYSGCNMSSSVSNQKHSFGYTTLSSDNSQSLSTLHVPPHVRPSINTQAPDSTSVTASDSSLDSDDDSIASAPDAFSMCTTNRLRKWRTKSGCRFINEYQILEVIGYGTCAKVKLAYDFVRSRLVALKEVVRADPKPRLGGPTQAQLNHESFMREVSVMKHLKHKNIVHLYEVIDDPHAEELYLVMQYVDKGAVADIKVSNNTDKVCEPIPPTQLAQVARQVLAGLEYLHRHNVVHRDIKPQNILIDSNGVLYLSDFGLAEVFDKQYLHRMHQMMEQSLAQSKDLIITEAKACVQKIWGVKGTMLFIAPEVWKGSSINGKPVDIWAMGVTLFTLLTGRLPFMTIDAVRDPTKPEIPTEYGAEWEELLKGMLERDTEKRMKVSRARFQVKKIIKMQAEQDSIKEVSDGSPGYKQLKLPGVAADINNEARNFHKQRKLVSPRSPEDQGTRSDSLVPHRLPAGVLSPIQESLSTSANSGAPITELHAVIRRSCQQYRWLSLCFVGRNLPKRPFGGITGRSARSVHEIDASGEQTELLSVVSYADEVSSNTSSKTSRNMAAEALPNSFKQLYTFPRSDSQLSLPHMQQVSSNSSKITTCTHPDHLPSSVIRMTSLNDLETQAITLSSRNPRTSQPWSKARIQLPPISTLDSTASAKLSLEEVNSVSLALSQRTDTPEKNVAKKY